MFIKIKIDKNGNKKAYKWSLRQVRWFPMKLEEAKHKLATEQAVESKDTDVPERKYKKN